MCIVDIAPCAFSKTSEGGLLFTSGISPVEDSGPRGKANLFIPKSDFRIFAFLKRVLEIWKKRGLRKNREIVCCPARSGSAQMSRLFTATELGAQIHKF